MRKLRHKNIQRQIKNLIPIIELCISLISEVEKTQTKLNILPNELESLKKQADYLSSKISQENSYDFQPQLQEIEFKLDSLVDDLEGVLTNLAIFDGKVKNVVALKEKLEAVQEERIDGITPERIYKLLEKHRRSSRKNPIFSTKFPNHKKTFSSSPNNKIESENRQKIKQVFSSKIAISIAMVTSVSFLSLGWVAGYNYANNMQFNNTNKTETR